MRQPTARYQNFLMDSDRWTGFPFRAGDIVISTPGKCGTTWTQMICALLIFQSTDFPQPLDVMSPWPDVFTRKREEVLADLEAQDHRRFLKTHTPLDGLPFDEQVTYVTVGRDPRDVAISFDNHMANTDFDSLMALRAVAIGEPLPAAPGDQALGAVGNGGLAGQAGPAVLPPGVPDPAQSPHQRFWSWIGAEDDFVGLRTMLHHLDTFWQARHLPNVVLLHYDEMKADLDGVMRRLADRLGISVPEDRWPDLVRAAEFTQMKRRAKELAPETVIWRDPDRFFHRGVSGQWRALLDEDDLRRYRERVYALVDPDLVAWIHQAAPLDRP
ncbi:sulfotransferase domain-containing protein [Plantactinospora sp. B5E13]|uniref:sulfotransferase domain-containing protein n=1 Tax=Plantactinospora sp. B5E13 TaxID=3153758 RepID=UPI00325F93DC